MFDIIYCIKDEHDPWLVVLAAAVCIFSAMTAVLMIRQSRRSFGWAAWRWAIMGGFATGFGIWATHFIAMLGYDPGVIAGYKVGLTVGSLAIVLLTTITAFLIAIRFRKPTGFAAAALLAGSGFSAMHYIGMAALEMPATIEWRSGYVLLSVVLAIVPLYPALVLTIREKTPRTAVAATAIITCAIVGLHFSGMTAIKLMPAPFEGTEALLSPTTMSVLVGAVSFLILGLCIIGWVVARRTAAVIAVSERQFSMLITGISDCAIYMLDRNGRVANWNSGAQRLTGYTDEEVVGMSHSNFYDEEGRNSGAPAQALEKALASGKYAAEGWRVRADRTRFWAHITIESIFDDEGTHLGFIKITRDMSQYKEDQDRIEEGRRHLDTALENMHQGLCLFDKNDVLVLSNLRFAELWNLPEHSCRPGWTLDEVATAALMSRTGGAVTEQQLEEMHDKLRLSLDDPSLPPLVWDFGDSFVVSITSRNLPDGGWVTTFEDITERRRSEAKIAHMALHDGLTGLPNRTSFNRWLEKEIAQSEAREEQVAVVAIDLDRFKEINDTHGHAAGDEVLQRIATALNLVLGENEIVARLGGDEFAAAKQFADQAELSEFVKRMCDCFDGLQAAEDGISVGASLGIALFPADARDRETLLNNADLAMYRAKGSIGEQICYYEPGMDESARHRRQLANDLRQAVVRDELRLLYQPQTSLKTNAVSGYEALLRWHHPRFGMVSPVDFIPIAEETGEIIRLGEWVLQRACEEAARWPRPEKIAVNISSVQLLQPNLPEIVTRILVETGLSPRRLELEITETAIISDKVRALHSLRQIKALGVSVAMDDFGTGYSSLDTLHSFPFDKIKIDKSFLLQSEESGQARAIIRAVLALGKSLGIPVLAEGVETEMQLTLLVDEGCEEAQGYYFGRPGTEPSLEAQRSILVK